MQPSGSDVNFGSIVAEILKGLQVGEILTDVNPGSVVRTLVEAFSRTLATGYERLNLMYQMGFIDTATDNGLDQLVAIVGAERMTGPQVVGDAVFTRTTGMSGRIPIPSGTLLLITKVSTQKLVQYQTTADGQLQAGQSTTTIPIAAVLPNGGDPSTVILTTDDLPASAGQAPARAVQMAAQIVGIGSVAIARPTVVRGSSETDDELRRRVKALIAAAGGGTQQAITQAILASGLAHQISFRDADSPDATGLLPGQLEITLDAALDKPETKAQLMDVINPVKGPGIQILFKALPTTPLSIHLEVTLDNPASSQMEWEGVRQRVATSVRGYVSGLNVGEPIRWNRLVAKVLTSPEVKDIQWVNGIQRTPSPGIILPGEGIGARRQLVIAPGHTSPRITIAGENFVNVQLQTTVVPSLDAQQAVTCALDEYLHNQNMDHLAIARTLTYEALRETVTAVATDAFTADSTLRFQISHVNGGQVLLVKPGDTYVVSPYCLIFPQLDGPQWGITP